MTAVAYTRLPIAEPNTDPSIPTINSKLYIYLDDDGNYTCYWYSGLDKNGQWEFKTDASSGILNIAVRTPQDDGRFVIDSIKAKPTKPSTAPEPTVTEFRDQGGDILAVQIKFHFETTGSNLDYVFMTVRDTTTGNTYDCDPQVGNDPPVSMNS